MVVDDQPRCLHPGRFNCSCALSLGDALSGYRSDWGFTSEADRRRVKFSGLCLSVVMIDVPLSVVVRAECRVAALPWLVFRAIPISWQRRYRMSQKREDPDRPAVASLVYWFGSPQPSWNGLIVGLLGRLTDLLAPKQSAAWCEKR
jgi:hypothetical protein